MLFVFWAAAFLFLAGPFFGLCARAARATHKNCDFFIMDIFQKFSLPFFLVRCVLVFGPTFFFLLVGRFFDLGSAGIRMWAPGMFPYGEVSVK